MSTSSSNEFHLPLAVGHRWEYEFHVARDLNSENILSAIGKFFGYEFRDLVSDEEMQEDYHIVKRIDEVVECRPYGGRDIYLVECRNFNAKGQEKLAHASAVWSDDDGFHLINLQAQASSANAVPDPGAMDLSLHVSVYHSGIFDQFMHQGQLYLKHGLKVGQTWDIDSVVREQELWLPAGWFNCYVVQRTMNLYGKDQTIESYYASDVGLVKVDTPLYSLTLSDLHLASD